MCIRDRTGETWNEVGFVNGHGTTTEAHAYTFEVLRLPPGRHAFRLRQIDTDGTVAFSPETTVEVGFEGAFYASEVYPSPVRGSGTVRVVMAAPNGLRAEVYDVLGRRIATFHDGLADVETRLRLDAGSWSPGVYVLRLTTPSGTVTRSFTVAR